MAANINYNIRAIQIEKGKWYTEFDIIEDSLNEIKFTPYYLENPKLFDSKEEAEKYAETIAKKYIQEKYLA